MVKDLHEYSTFEKVLFYLGWIYALSLIFWIVMFIVNNYTGESKFWNSYTFRSVFYFGWLALFSIPICLIIIFSGLF
jgi:hypothetical protein